MRLVWWSVTLRYAWRLLHCCQLCDSGSESGLQVRLLLLAAFSGEHLLLLGPPGTAKSELVRLLEIGIVLLSPAFWFSYHPYHPSGAHLSGAPPQQIVQGHIFRAPADSILGARGAMAVTRSTDIRQKLTICCRSCLARCPYKRWRRTNTCDRRMATFPMPAWRSSTRYGTALRWSALRLCLTQVAFRMHRCSKPTVQS